MQQFAYVAWKNEGTLTKSKQQLNPTMQEGTEGFQRAIGKHFGRHRSGEIPAQHAKITLELPPAQSRKMGQG